MTEPSRRRVSYNQLEALWEILNRRREIALGFNKTSQAREFARRMWEEVALTLNSQGDGAVKDGKGWSKYWNDYKSKLKKLAAAQRSSNEQTGGGPSTVKPLEDIEKKFLQILGENFGFGLPGARVEPFEDVIQTERCTPLTAASSMHPVYSSGEIGSTRDHDQPGPSWRVTPQQGSTWDHNQPGPSWMANPLHLPTTPPRAHATPPPVYATPPRVSTPPPILRWNRISMNYIKSIAC
ncbi:Uncharacterized protein OBRU01_10513 [Operophtera brumata]|uniref:Regulatory protein zeste n=1 Tax=Operophtera brumata TaxID=104452 RepID=A0A0L7L021_OPEBR|nr:Uncharacterized protein OBRU01_10513 [Operophtera brumata]